MQPSKPADAGNLPKPEVGKIPDVAIPSPPPASTNALGSAPSSSMTGGGLKSLENMPLGSVLIMLVTVAWVVFGLLGFIMSLWCFGFSGDTGVKLGGLLFAILLGPFYWVYFYSVPSYCARLPPPSLF